MSAPTPIPDPNPPTPSEPSLAPNVAAGIACLFSLVSGAVFLVIERHDKFVRFWAMQSLLWGLVAIGVAIVVAIAGPVFDWLPIIGLLMKLVLKLTQWAFNVVWVVVYLVCLIRAFGKQEWEIPVIGKFARQLLGRPSDVLPAA